MCGGRLCLGDDPAGALVIDDGIGVGPPGIDTQRMAAQFGHRGTVCRRNVRGTHSLVSRGSAPLSTAFLTAVAQLFGIQATSPCMNTLSMSNEASGTASALPSVASQSVMVPSMKTQGRSQSGPKSHRSSISRKTTCELSLDQAGDAIRSNQGYSSPFVMTWASPEMRSTSARAFALPVSPYPPGAVSTATLTVGGDFAAVAAEWAQWKVAKINR